MWDFNHPPLASALADRYQIHSTQPSRCAEDLLADRADLGLIPVASLTSELAIVSDCTIASLDRVRSIQVIIKLDHRHSENTVCHSERSEESPYSARAHTISEPINPESIDRALVAVRTVAADTASRSSLVYAQILFRKFIATDPTFLPAPADPIAMLQQADAALLIGDPALVAQENRAHIEAAVGPCLWLDLAHQWTTRTHLPWVAAVWAVRPEAIADSAVTPAQLTADLQHSRDHGLTRIDSLVEEWTPRIAIPPATIRHYLTRNIHYTLSPACIDAITLFRRYAAELAVLPPLSALRLL
jgi:chorismate dehydratase